MLLLPPAMSISLKSEAKNILQILQKRKQIEGIPERSYLSNFEML